MKKNIIKKISRLVLSVCAALLCLNMFTNLTISAKAEGSNPYYGGWSNCTWSAWQLVYEATGIALPSWGNAGDWYANAAASGYTVSSEPRANSIGVWSGHVVYVTDFDGSNIYLKEGGFLGGYNEAWADGYSSRYGEALLGYIYISGDMSEIEAPTYSEQIASYLYGTASNDSTVERAIAPEIIEQNIENLEEDVIKMYDPELVETKKNEELQAIKDMQEEESLLTGSSNQSTTSVSKSSLTASLTSSILAPLTSKKK